MRAANGRSGVEECNRLRQITEKLRRSEKAEVARERRAAPRQPFVRPVVITIGRSEQTEIEATSSTLSDLGISLIHDVALEPGRVGVLTIHRLRDDPVMMRAESRWCEQFCKHWFVSGWRFISEGR